MIEFGWNLVYYVGVVAVLLIIAFLAIMILTIIAGQIKDVFNAAILGHDKAKSLQEKKESHGQDA